MILNNELISSSDISVDNLILLIKQATGRMITTERLVLIDTLIVNASSPPIMSNEFYLILGNAGNHNDQETLNFGVLTYNINANTQNRGFIFNNWITPSSINYLVLLIRIV